MHHSKPLDTYLQLLLEGKRQACCEVIHNELDKSDNPQEIYYELLWPAMEKIEGLFRQDHINIAVEHMATRINRLIADQVQDALPKVDSNGKRILISCADSESQELGAQMCADLFESNGWETYFLGGGVPNDEILELVGELRPDVLLIHGMTPSGVPAVRALIDLIRDVGVNPTMNIMVTGGVFNRAEDLWKEINVDLYAVNAREAIDIADQAAPRTPTTKIPGAPKKRRRRRRPPLMSGMRSA